MEFLRRNARICLPGERGIPLGLPMGDDSLSTQTFWEKETAQLEQGGSPLWQKGGRFCPSATRNSQDAPQQGLAACACALSPVIALTLPYSEDPRLWPGFLFP